MKNHLADFSAGVVAGLSDARTRAWLTKPSLLSSLWIEKTSFHRWLDRRRVERSYPGGAYYKPGESFTARVGGVPFYETVFMKARQLGQTADVEALAAKLKLLESGLSPFYRPEVPVFRAMDVSLPKSVEDPNHGERAGVQGTAGASPSVAGDPGVPAPDEPGAGRAGDRAASGPVMFATGKREYVCMECRSLSLSYTVDPTCPVCPAGVPKRKITVTGRSFTLPFQYESTATDGLTAQFLMLEQRVAGLYGDLQAGMRSIRADVETFKSDVAATIGDLTVQVQHLDVAIRRVAESHAATARTVDRVITGELPVAAPVTMRDYCQCNVYVAGCVYNGCCATCGKVRQK